MPKLYEWGKTHPDTLDEKLDERELNKIEQAFISETTSEKISKLPAQEQKREQSKKLDRGFGRDRGLER